MRGSEQLKMKSIINSQTSSKSELSIKSKELLFNYPIIDETIEYIIEKTISQIRQKELENELQNSIIVKLQTQSHKIHHLSNLITFNFNNFNTQGFEEMTLPESLHKDNYLRRKVQMISFPISLKKHKKELISTVKLQHQKDLKTDLKIKESSSDEKLTKKESSQKFLNETTKNEENSQKSSANKKLEILKDRVLALKKSRMSFQIPDEFVNKLDLLNNNAGSNDLSSKGSKIGLNLKKEPIDKNTKTKLIGTFNMSGQLINFKEVRQKDLKLLFNKSRFCKKIFCSGKWQKSHTSKRIDCKIV